MLGINRLAQKESKPSLKRIRSETLAIAQGNSSCFKRVAIKNGEEGSGSIPKF